MPDNYVPTHTPQEIDKGIDDAYAEAERAKDSEHNIMEKLGDHKRDKNNPHGITKSQLGLDQVDNTSDANKPISTETREALVTLGETLRLLAAKVQRIVDYGTVYQAGEGITIDNINDTISVTQEVLNEIDNKQDKLSQQQLNAVNSGITTEKVTEFEGKQNALNQAQLDATNSGVTAEKVTTYDGLQDKIDKKQDIIDEEHPIDASCVDGLEEELTDFVKKETTVGGISLEQSSDRLKNYVYDKVETEAGFYDEIDFSNFPEISGEIVTVYHDDNNTIALEGLEGITLIQAIQNGAAYFYSNNEISEGGLVLPAYTWKKMESSPSMHFVDGKPQPFEVTTEPLEPEIFAAIYSTEAVEQTQTLGNKIGAIDSSLNDTTQRVADLEEEAGNYVLQQDVWDFWNLGVVRNISTRFDRANYISIEANKQATNSEDNNVAQMLVGFDRFFQYRPTIQWYVLNRDETDSQGNLYEAFISLTHKQLKMSAESINLSATNEATLNGKQIATLDDIPAQTQTDWNESSSSSPAYLKNKPSLGTAAALNTGTQQGDVPILGADGKLPSSVLPPIAIKNTFVVNSEAAMLALTAQTGDMCIRTDLSKSFVLTTDDPTVVANWQELLTPPNAVLSVNGQTGAVQIGKAEVGLGNVTNTGDSATPTQNGTEKFTTGGAYDLKDALETLIGNWITINQTVIPGSGSTTERTDTEIFINGVRTLIKAYTKIDSTLSPSSKNPVTNDVIYNAISNKVDAEDLQYLESIVLTTLGIKTGTVLMPVEAIIDGNYYPTVVDNGNRWNLQKADSPTYFKIYDVSQYNVIHLKAISRAGHILTNSLPADFITRIHQNPTQVTTWKEYPEESGTPVGTNSEQADAQPRSGYTPYDKDLTTNGKHYLIVYEGNAAQAIEVTFGGGYSPIPTSMFTNDGDGTTQNDPYAKMSDIKLASALTASVTVGGITSGDSWPTGTSIETILRALLDPQQP